MGLIQKPWDERKRSDLSVMAELQPKFTAVSGVNIFATAPSAIPVGAGDLPIVFVLTYPGDYTRLADTLDKLKAEADKSGLFIFTNADLRFQTPQVELVAVSRDDSTPAGALVIRYVVRDPLIAPRAVRVLYSPNAEGPWATIADGIDNQGEHRWTPDKAVPAKVHIRVEATDLAGNVGAAVSPNEISIAAPRFGGKLGGLRPLPTAP